jgi:hypothetical protein
MSLKSIAMIGSDHIEFEINIDYHLCISFTLSKSCRLGLITSQSLGSFKVATYWLLIMLLILPLI